MIKVSKPKDMQVQEVEEIIYQLDKEIKKANQKIEEFRRKKKWKEQKLS